MPREINPVELFPPGQFYEIERLGGQTHPSLVPLAQERLQSFIDFYAGQVTPPSPMHKTVEKIWITAELTYGMGSLTGGIVDRHWMDVALGSALLGMAARDIVEYRRDRKSEQSPPSDPRLEILNGSLTRLISQNSTQVDSA